MTTRSWQLVTIVKGGDHPAELAALRADGVVVEVPELKGWAGAAAVLDDWTAAAERLRPLDLQGAVPIEGARLVTPLSYPRKVICAGVNYRRHIVEMGAQLPGEAWTPFFFLKPPTTTVIGPYDVIAISADPALRMDWEAELCVVVGPGGRDIPTERALEHVAGYCVANDISARGLHRREHVPAPAFSYDWFASKSQDASLPIGPGITPSWFVPDPQTLQIRLWVNDQLHQDESTADMICSVAELVAAASRVVTLEPGDLIPTGTPSGVGGGQGLSLHPGDIVRTEIAGLGTLVNPVVER
jgi:2-keto-4-pentenoate hydratase/2-oxohepta-3-ene-1,7-dioic acid hydratase in catechol pathway